MQFQCCWLNLIFFQRNCLKLVSRHLKIDKILLKSFGNYSECLKMSWTIIYAIRDGLTDGDIIWLKQSILTTFVFGYLYYSTFKLEGASCLLYLVLKRPEGWRDDFRISLSESRVSHFYLVRSTQLITSIDVMDVKRKTFSFQYVRL